MIYYLAVDAGTYDATFLATEKLGGRIYLKFDVVGLGTLALPLTAISFACVVSGGRYLIRLGATRLKRNGLGAADYRRKASLSWHPIQPKSNIGRK